jgi:serine/threonine-protein kinase
VGDSPVAVAGMHVRDAVPSPRTFNPQVPADLELVTMHALAKRPDSRYESADELRADLVRFSDGQPVVAGRRAFSGDDATRAVAVVSAGAAWLSAGERTQAVPIQPGPKPIERRGNNRRPWIIAGVVLALRLPAASSRRSHSAARRPSRACRTSLARA